MRKLGLIRFYNLIVLFITVFFLAYPPKIGVSQGDINPNGAQYKSGGIPYDIAELKHDVEKLEEERSETIKEKLNKPPKVVVKTKTVQPKSIRIYYRVNGEVISENVLTKEGDFFILDIDSVLPEVLPETDPVKESIPDFKLDTIEKKKWWQFKRK